MDARRGIFSFFRTLILICLFLITGTKGSFAAEMVLIESGRFMMQETDVDGSQIGIERLTLVSNFFIDRYPVTSSKWKEVRKWGMDNGYRFRENAGCPNNHPALVTWYDAVLWCNARSEMEGLTPVYYKDKEKREVYRGPERIDLTHSQVSWNADGYRLPTDAEWEFAARGGNLSNGFIYSGSNNSDEVAWYRDNSEGSECEKMGNRGTRPVGMKDANELGLYDMSGNMDEWCWDWSGPLKGRWRLFGPRYATDPRGPKQGSERVIRGGGFLSSLPDLHIRRRPMQQPGGFGAIRTVRLVIEADAKD